MRLFISYARVDKPYCAQIVETLEAHENWYDQRLYPGQNWWKEILRRLDWCEGFVYLLSKDSIASDYCIREYQLARSLQRPIFPILIQEGVTLPEGLAEIHYVDFSKGITSDGVKILLNSILLAERHMRQQQFAPPRVRDAMSTDEIEPPVLDPGAVIGAAAEAMEKGEFDRAVYLLRLAIQNNYESRFIDIRQMLAEAEQGLARQTYLKEAAREYKQIADLMRYKRTLRLGCNAFTAFRTVFADYDPDNLTRTWEEFTNTRRILTIPINKPTSNAIPQIPLLEWVRIPAGTLLVNPGQPANREHRIRVEAYDISRYPVTNEQYQLFLDSPAGYADMRWWNYSRAALQWRRDNPVPAPSQFRGAERPRETVNWFDSMAFANWLSSYLGFPIRLPTVVEWMRAARGDDGRIYPWGNEFTPEFCNTKERKLRQTSQVTSYPGGASPFGVIDLAGNVWEWCLNGKSDAQNGLSVREDLERAVHGGSHIGPADRAQISFRYYLDPRLQYSSIGFRLMRPVR